MSEAASDNGETGDQQQGAQFAIERIYIKDVSLETPRGIEAFGNWQPHVDLDINTRQTHLEDNRYEVVLTLTVTTKNKETDEVYFLLELQQAGIFLANNFKEGELRQVLGTVAPQTLFPYARETIDSLAVKANFPALRLAPINFDALWQAARQQPQSSGSQTLQ